MVRAFFEWAYRALFAAACKWKTSATCAKYAVHAHARMGAQPRGSQILRAAPRRLAFIALMRTNERLSPAC